MPQSPRVFISSTWVDLQPEREAVEKALHRMQSTAFAGMEYFGSRPETPKQVSLTEVDRSDIYIGIFAHRYGSGITEDEYRRALERKLPCLIYIKDDEAPVLPAHIERDAEKSAKLENLKGELKQKHTVSTFRTPDHLATQVVADLHKLLGKSAATEHERPAQPEAKYAIHIDNAQGVVIGDQATVTQNFGNPAKPDFPQATETTASGNTLATQLYETLIKRFDLEELRTLCFRINIEFDDLRGENRDGKVRELVRLMQRKEQLQLLQSGIEQMLRN